MKRFIPIYCILFIAVTLFAAPDKLWLELNESADWAMVQPQLETMATIRYYSPALHAVSVSSPDMVLIQQKFWLKSTRPMGYFHPPEPLEAFSLLNKSALDSAFYGAMYGQLKLVNIPLVHQRGYTGRGVKIGILDTGFKKSLAAFERILSEGRLIGEKDFIGNDSNTDQDPEDGSTVYNTHGTACWSEIGAYIEGTMVGGAYNAQFAIARTEIYDTETRIEEDYYVSGIEWFNSLGVDVVSSSLSYYDFDGDSEDYLPSALDGQSTMVARICNWAAGKGMIIVTAMGNEGPGESTLWSPADAPGVISVGSIAADGLLSTFSAQGPTADGRIKPEVVAQGEACALSSISGNVYYSRGTSFAAPVIASGAALIKEAYPNWTVYDVQAAFAAYSTQTSQNNQTGWGVPDFFAIITHFHANMDSAFVLKAYPNPASLTITFEWTNLKPITILTIYNILGQKMGSYSSISLDPTHSLPVKVYPFPAGVYFARVGEHTVKFTKL